jgi:AcrR family transcriptional regulator
MSRVAMSLVLYHFGNKDELVAAIVERGYRTLLDSMRSSRSRDAGRGVSRSGPDDFSTSGSARRRFRISD